MTDLATMTARLGELLAFDCTGFPDMEDKAIKWANHIAGKKGERPNLLDPVGILELCEDVAKVSATTVVPPLLAHIAALEAELARVRGMPKPDLHTLLGYEAGVGDERRECAKVAEEYETKLSAPCSSADYQRGFSAGADDMALAIAAAIRARGGGGA